MKLFRKGSINLLTVCDSDLIGEKIETPNGIYMVEEDFYGSEDMNIDEITGSLIQANVVNILGKRVVKWFIEREYINEYEIISLEGVPHSQFYLL